MKKAFSAILIVIVAFSFSATKPDPPKPVVKTLKKIETGVILVTLNCGFQIVSMKVNEIPTDPSGLAGCPGNWQVTSPSSGNQVKLSITIANLDTSQKHSLTIIDSHGNRVMFQLVANGLYTARIDILPGTNSPVQITGT